MYKLPYAKYYFSIMIVAILTCAVAKFATDSLLILIPFAVVLFLVSVKGFNKIKGYQ